MRGEIRLDHYLEKDNFEPDDTTSYENDILNELDKLKKSGNYQQEVEFEVHAPFSNIERTSMISWDFSRHLSIPH